MRGWGGIAAVAAVLGLAGPLAPLASAQSVYFEPMPMREGVHLPPGAHLLNAIAAPQLGIATPTSVAATLDPALGLPGPRAANLPFPPPRDLGPRTDILVIPALFSDSEEPHITAEDMQRVLFDGPSESGTFTEFWAEVSRGAFEAGGLVTPWVRTDVTLFEASGGFDGHGWIGERMQDYVRQAVERVDPDVDFGQFDNDGPDGVPNSGDDDGRVDAFSIQFLEVGGSCGGPAIWPHFSGVFEPSSDGEREPLATDDLRPDGSPVRILTYFTQGVTDCSGVEIQGPNIIAHEFGHSLGLPDWYQPVEGIEPEDRHWNIGCWGLMGGGSWGCGTELRDASFGPTHPAALSRYLLGWADLTMVGEVEDQEFVLEPVQTTGQMLAVRLDPGLPEWFLVEYRPRIGFDEPLPAGGVLIYHFDRYDGTRQIPPDLPPARVYHLVEADGDHALRKVQRLGGDRGVAADAFGLPGSPDALDADTEPSTRVHIGERSAVTFRDIRIEDGRAYLRITSRPVLATSGWTLPSRVPALDPFTGELTVSGGTPPYEAEAQATGVPVLDLQTSVEDGIVTLEGRPLASGEVRVLVAVRDGDGNVAVREAELVADDLDLADVELVAGLTTGSPVITAEIGSYLDAAGNANGSYDLGDLRAYVLRR